MSNSASSRIRLDKHGILFVRGRAMAVEARDTHSVLARDIQNGQVKLFTDTDLRALWVTGELVVQLGPRPQRSSAKHATTPAMQAAEYAIRASRMAYVKALRRVQSERKADATAAALADVAKRLGHAAVPPISSARRWSHAFTDEQGGLTALGSKTPKRKPRSQPRKHEFPCGCAPEVILFDGGPEFTHRPRRYPYTELGIGARLVPAGKKRFKATIERSMRRAKRGD